MENEEACRFTVDCIVEILIRLPVKSLLRFKLVCKIWYYLIKSPYFVKLHLQYSFGRNNCILDMRNSRGGGRSQWFAGPDLSLCFRSCDSFDLIDERPIAMEIPEFTGPYNFFCGTCDGLLCISDFRVNTLIWNPAIREYKKLPLPPFVSPEFFVSPEPFLDIFVAVGFGFDPIMNDYKVVVFARVDFHGYVDFPVNVGIYNFSTNSWRQIGQIHTLSVMCPGYSSGCPIKGAFHWLAAKDVDNRKRNLIVSFSLSTEIVGYIEIPDDPLVKGPSIPVGFCLTEFNESLALFAFSLKFASVWVMLEYGVVKSWTKRFNFTTMSPPFMLRKNELNLIVEGQQVSCGIEASEVIADEAHGFHLIPGLVIYQESLVWC